MGLELIHHIFFSFHTFKKSIIFIRTILKIFNIKKGQRFVVLIKKNLF